MAKRGPKKWLPSEADLEKIEKLGRLGVPKMDVARALGIGHDTLFKRMNEMPEISEAYKRGKAAAYQFVVSKLFKRIDAEDLGAICFWLKCQAGWRDRDSSTIVNLGEQNQLYVSDKKIIESFQRNHPLLQG